VDLLDASSFPASPMPISASSGRDLWELLGSGAEKREPPLACDLSRSLESRPLSALSTSAGATPSPEEMASLLQPSYLEGWRAGSPCSGVEDAPEYGWPHESMPAAVDPQWLSSPSGAAPDDLPMLVRPSSQCCGVGIPTVGRGAAAPSMQLTECGTLSSGGSRPAADPNEHTGLYPWAGAARATASTPPAVLSLDEKLEQAPGAGRGRRERRGGRARAWEQPQKAVRHDGKSQQDSQHLTKALVVQLSRTQAGSKLLQRKLLKGHPSVIKDILEGIETDLPDIMCNMYGNYLCSAAFQACSVAQRLRMLEIASRHLRSIATDRWGTHALQSLISLVCTEEEQELLTSALQEHVVELSCDPNGAHVVQRALIGLGMPCPEPILREVTQCLRRVADNPHGLCVLKKCITQTRQGVNQELLLQEISSHAVDLVQGPYGNYAVQHAFEEWGGETCRPILEALRGRLVQLSIQKFSSNVVEHLLRLAPAEAQHWIFEELTSPDQVQVLASSVYGHYVARRMLQTAPREQRSALESSFSSCLSGLRNPRLREKMEHVLAGDRPDEPSAAVTGEVSSASAKRRGPRGRRAAKKPGPCSAAGAAASTAPPPGLEPGGLSSARGGRAGGPGSNGERASSR